ncbi:MAG: 2-succinyl-5-enolpyruvyl-6-hydroxy-3-cyclohexene-1-carboxylic-acid synthase [Sporichthyaceae bacterium]
MNPSTALATVIVDELIRGGVREAVLCPGSRNAPLSFALHQADTDGRLRLHVRIDERTAGFLALGLSKASGQPVPVMTTSGTAAVNLHPAVVEADYSRVRLVVLTADRPAEMHGTGANQTIDQTNLYGRSVRFFAGVNDSLTVAEWRKAVAHALGQGHSGPIHLNVAFREPLLPDGDPTWPEPLDIDIERTQTGTATWGYTAFEAGGRTAVVAGDQSLADARGLAEAGGWPLLAEPSSGHRAGPNALAVYRLLLDHLGADIERVVVAGRPTLSRAVSRLLARDDIEVVRLRDEPRTPAVRGRSEDDTWLRRWQDTDAAARKAIAAVVSAEPLTGLSVAQVVARAVPADGLLVAGSSSPVRDLDLADPWDEPPLVLANRGASGIDGTVSTAVGAALAHGGPSYGLMGDLTVLHDSTGLVIGPDEPRPDLTIVVINDNGGGLFAVLEQGAPEHAAVFERLFGTPHGVDFTTLCAATGTSYALIDTASELTRALAPSEGLRVLEVRTDRTSTRDLHDRLAAAVAAAV